MVAAGGLERQLQGVGDVVGLHGRAQLPGHDVAREVVQDLRRSSPQQRADADDIAQETLVRALASGEVARHPRAFLQRIARNIAIDEARKFKVRGGVALQVDALPDHLAPFTDADQEMTLLLKQIILGLPELYRDVFILNRFHGMSYAEIAVERGLSVKAVEYRMSRALALCEEALRD
ncbi:RNA polymerase sigma factor [Phenylobacterium sp. NIBR 498073]|nr:RNA polymerase sigma factor [Phenylobacterium sp. NIBR 498073]WGU42206.1 RNA polymerase sigma factor [Phenylobacterium sp. NIBR 498073]